MNPALRRSGAAAAAAAAIAVLFAVMLLPTGLWLPAPAAVDSPPTPATSSAPATPGRASSVVEPTAMRIAAIGVTSTLVPVGVDDTGAVQVPTDIAQAAWAAFTPAPGDVGPAVLLGHVNGHGRPGVFARLHELQPGAEILVDRTDGITARFVVDRVEQVEKDAFPTQAVYGDVDRPELRLITCGGELDRAAHRYLGQVIAYAHLT